MADEPDRDGPVDRSRREFLIHSTVATGTLVVVTTLTAATATHAAKGPTEGLMVPVTLKVNGAEHSLRIDPRTTRLDALRVRDLPITIEKLL